jgi:kumamolisin
MIEEINRTLAEAAWLGTTVTVASGDHGAMSWLNDGSVHAEFPASSPFVLGCGGTALQIGEDGVEREVVWKTDANHGTGGGVSECFERPAWQVTANVPLSLTTKFAGRGVPDVAAYADLAVGYVIRANGQDTRGGGTSAAAPLWAGLIALINERLTAKAGVTAGYITPLLYDHIALSAFHDVEDGDNNGYAAGPDWDPCTGWGSPNGAELLRQLTTNENSARAPSRQRRGHRASSSAS